MTVSVERSARRVALMRLCAQATDLELSSALLAIGPVPDMAEIRPPEIGLTMLRGRMGGDGPPFNLGEATVTRAAVRLRTGETGMSYLLGRRPGAARAAATIDALDQVPRFQPMIDEALVGPVAGRLAHEQAIQRAEVAATKVDFFTLVRGEDQPS